MDFSIFHVCVKGIAMNQNVNFTKDRGLMVAITKESWRIGVWHTYSAKKLCRAAIFHVRNDMVCTQCSTLCWGTAPFQSFSYTDTRCNRIRSDPESKRKCENEAATLSAQKKSSIISPFWFARASKTLGEVQKQAVLRSSPPVLHFVKSLWNATFESKFLSVKFPAQTSPPSSRIPPLDLCTAPTWPRRCYHVFGLSTLAVNETATTTRKHPSDVFQRTINLIINVTGVFVKITLSSKHISQSSPPPTST